MPFESWGLIGLFASAFISSTVAPGGSEAVLAYLVSRHGHSVLELVAIASVGNTLGALTTWWLGQWGAQKYPAESLVKDRQRSLQTIRRWGAWALLLSWLPLIGDGLCFAAGWLRLSFLASLTAIFFGKVLRYIAVAYVFV
ncbi:YqaA family protein [Methylomonas sp. MED-D]|uniref:VTT domain-containing protein n=1 Tax=Methylomonas koyamae TaxID=702114 RepID=A0A177NJZ1_9GAMM|nr:MULTISPECIES: YqaA family protein [Methylomonas]MDT4330404.1 YqaA family protein [Methylomonas sp. MV1]OAI17884.1 hypothetical protein A1355_06800 [Methylomonas koyamae]